jgi:DNA-binding transcriptional LysR family regulator
MNWDAIAFDWNQARAFLATAEEGSLSAAARALGLTQPTLGRQVAALEETLGVVLFERAGRSLVLTEAGRDLLDHVRTMADAAGRVSLAASGQSKAIEGKVSISTSDVMAAYMLPPILKRLKAAAPRLEIIVVASNSLSDLRRREADIAIRHVRPDHPELMARLIREARACFYATPDYLNEAGNPRTLEELARADFISFGDRDQLATLFSGAGVPVSPESFKIGSANGVSAWQMVRQGLGVGIMAEEVAALTPEVVAALPDMEPFLYPIWLVTHRELHTSRKIRLVFDLLAEELLKLRPPEEA